MQDGESRLRIGIFTCNYKPLLNGLSSSIEIFSREFRRRGHEVFIFAPRYPGHTEQEEGVFRFPSLRAPTHHQYTLPIPFSPRVATLLPRLELDLIHAQHPFLLGAYGGRVARRLSLPLVFTHHTLYEEYTHYLPLAPALARWWVIRMSVSFANQADLVIAPTRGLRDLLRARGVRTRIEVVPTGVEVEDEEGPVLSPRELGLPSGSRFLLSVGRLAREKNLNALLEAFGRIAPEFSDCCLVLVGDGDERRHLERISADMGLQGRVIFTGAKPREELRHYYRNAELLLFTSLSEAQGLVVAESMAHGLPVVALRSFAVEDLIEDGSNGCLASDLNEFVDRVRDLLLDPEKRRRFSQGARSKIREFAAPTLAERVLDLYRELLPRERGR